MEVRQLIKLIIDFMITFSFIFSLIMLLIMKNTLKKNGYQTVFLTGLFRDIGNMIDLSVKSKNTGDRLKYFTIAH